MYSFVEYLFLNLTDLERKFKKYDFLSDIIMESIKDVLLGRLGLVLPKKIKIFFLMVKSAW